MKACLLETYTALGILAARQHFMDAGAEYVRLLPSLRLESKRGHQGGLEVKITPALEVPRSGFKIESINLDNLYTVQLVIRDEESEGFMSSVESCFHDTVNGLTSLAYKYGCSPLELMSGHHPELANQNMDGMSVSLLRNSGATQDRFEDDATKSTKHNEVEDSLEETLESGTYITGWRLSGDILTKWIKEKVLTISKTSTMKSSAFLEKAKGVYSFTWGFYEEIPVDGDVEAHVQYLGQPSTSRPHQIRFDFDVEELQMPSSYYKRIERILQTTRFLKRKRREDDPVKGRCDDFSIYERALNMEMEFTSLISIELLAKRYVKQDSIVCTFFIDESPDNNWILGASILGIRTVILDARGGVLQFHFQVSKAPRLTIGG
uniref:AlNc14C39G3352 protein n=1 Tax=Albugo laibachii Nc14 TaxID=890382 RepID=F0W985_9STRA|nr:AlNc14C39G3352 [Albugo laibachii Nc14]CCA18344.1 AlNc14C49G3877 [Albugo laibachii Nc14]|eukprot:CCA18344.1 AlNc14C49G3877 [Albugo laibachii Nc14]